jgi:lipoic acid synthetase
MVGLGEDMREVEETLVDLRSAGCRVVTVGQYLRPTRGQVAVEHYWSPAEFVAIEHLATGIGLEVVAGPLVRSSYRAEQVLGQAARS